MNTITKQKAMHHTPAQRLIELFLALMIISFALESLWKHDLVWQVATGSISLCVLVISIIVGKLYRYKDVWFLLVFLFIGWLSSAVNFGITASYFISRFHCLWIVFLALYMVMSIVPDPSRAMRVFVCISTVCFSVLCAFVMVHAAGSLLTDPPGVRIVLGCFRVGRLCGMGNANILGFMCTSLFLISLYGFLITKKRIRILYLIAAILGWFVLGLTGCRTGMIGISSAVGLAIFSSFFWKIAARKTWHIVLRFLAAMAVGIAAGVILLLSLYLPIIIFRGIMQGIQLIIHNPYLPQNLAKLSIHKILDDDGTLSSRLWIWVKCIQDSFKTVRRALFGISPLSNDVVAGFAAGHHEYTAPHAHNILLDILRRFGFLGLAPWIGLLIMWIRRGANALFKTGSDAPDRFLISCIGGLLVMGLAEPVPFSDIVHSFIAIPFFIIIGYCMRKVRDQS